MSDKDLTTNVKTVLHGEVLGPEDEGYELKKKGSMPHQKEYYINDMQRRMGQNSRQNYFQGVDMGSRLGCQLGGNFGQWHQPNFYGCQKHMPSPHGFYPCAMCGKY